MPSVSVETEKKDKYEKEFKEATKKKEEAQASLKKAESALDKAKQAVEQAKTAVEKAAKEEVEAKTKFDNQVKQLDKVTKYVAEVLALEEKYGKLFDEMDGTKDGSVSHIELKKYITEKDYTLRLQLGIGRWQEFLDEVDLDGDRKVSRSEFVYYFTMRNLDPVKCWGSIFDAIDTNRDGELTRNELRNYSWNENPYILKLLGFKSWGDLMDEVDKDMSGTIDRDEWLSFFAMKEITGAYHPAKRRKC